MNGWLNIYKPRGFSSAKIVAMVRRVFKGDKVGHTGTLDLEAEGVLPIAIGQATKLVSILIDAKKQYAFTVKFGAQTDTADSAGVIVKTVDYVPNADECESVCERFIGEVEQTPPAYSALKVDGKRAYKLARQGVEVNLAKRKITIYDLKCVAYDEENGTASYICTCSKGTYIRSLAEDISLSLQSLGFVIELRRLKVGIFEESNSIDISAYMQNDVATAQKLLQPLSLKMEDVLDDIPVLEADDACAQRIIFGQKCQFDCDQNYDLAWVRHKNRVIAIGSLTNSDFKSSRVFNY